MGVNGGGDFLVGGLHRNRQAQLGDHFCRVRADDVRSENFAMWLADDKFYETVGLADGQGFAACQKWELADPILETFLLGGPFGEANARDLRLTVGTAGKCLYFPGLGDTKYSLHGLNGFEASHMGEPGWTDDVSGSVDSLDVCFVVLVGFDPALLIGFNFDARGNHRADTDSHQSHTRLDSLRALSRTRQLHPVLSRLSFLHLGARENLQPLLGKRFLESHADLCIFDRENVRQHFDDGDLGAKGVEEVGKLDADGASADDDDVLGLLR